MLEIIPDTIGQFRSTAKIVPARKSARSKLRPVTTEDIRLGVVTPQSLRTAVPGRLITMETKDGQPEVIRLGEYIAEGKIGELHRVTADFVAKLTEVEVDQDDPRWTYYVNGSVRQAIQMTEPAHVVNPRGDEFNAVIGDWLIDMGDDWWIVECQQFAYTHDLL